MSEQPRLIGTVVTCYPSKSRYGGSFGEIAGDDGRHYVFSDGCVYRNRSHAVERTRVTFTSRDGTYATGIDQINKGGLP